MLGLFVEHVSFPLQQGVIIGKIQWFVFPREKPAEATNLLQQPHCSADSVGRTDPIILFILMEIKQFTMRPTFLNRFRSQAGAEERTCCWS